MSRRTKIIIGVTGVVLVLGIALFLFLRFQIRKSFPQVSGNVTVSGLLSAVEIFRDEYGVPRIIAANEHDLMIAAGYVHAQDRLWQMDLIRRVGEGRLSELFGTATVPFDRMFRTIGIRDISEEIDAHIDSTSHHRLEWYARGVNAFIATHRGQYPVEFDFLGYEPEPWEPVHSIMIGRLMAWELNLSWWTDLTLGALMEKVGRDKAMEVFPTYPGSVAPTVPGSAMRSFAQGGEWILHAAHAYREFMGTPGMQGGSNAWVIGPSKSTSGGVLLANDTHLQLQNPSKWYEIEYSAPEYTVSGMSVPGTPSVVAGHNTHIAWGITNVMADDADFYIERLDSTGLQYLYDDRWYPVSVRNEEIQVRGDTAVQVMVRSTRHGPIVTDIRTPLKKADLPFVASMRWTGYVISDQIDAFHTINIARNWKEFLAGVRKFSGPGQNFVYGDVEGNIGYWCGVQLPVRGNVNSTLPLPGWESGSEWKGYVPFEQLPHLYNPAEGYIATANNRIVDESYPYFISNLWEPPSRIVRLREQLGKGELFSLEDCTRLQNDSFSHLAKEMTPFILRVLRSAPDSIEHARVLQEYFENWNFVFNASDVPTAIFHEWYVRLLHNIYHDEMGDELFHDFVILVNIPIRVTTRLLQEGRSSWFDDISTGERETRDDIVLRSLRQASEALRERLGNDMKTWRWGEIHEVTFRHPFGLVKPLDKLFDIGPFPYGGGPTALVSGEYSFNEPFRVTVGSSFRMVVDLADPGRAIRVLPPGQSGQVFHRHFRDQAPLWLNGGYRMVVLDPERFDTRQWDLLRLEPGT